MEVLREREWVAVESTLFTLRLQPLHNSCSAEHHCIVPRAFGLTEGEKRDVFSHLWYISNSEM